jgi:sugar O-acyltransferase (sialic acid O-acetyltransferase NeuD family)
MKKVVLFGTGKTAQVMYYHIQREGGVIAGFAIDREFYSDKTLYNFPVVPFDVVEKKFPPEEYDMMIAIGYKNVNLLRAKRVAQAEEKGYRLVNYVSPSAIIWDNLSLQSNCKIGERTILQPYSDIEKNVFIGSGCIIGHHAKIMKHCFIASGVIVGGGVVIEPYCFLGTGSTIRNDIIVKEASVIGAGVTILENTEPQSVYLNRSAEKMSITSKSLNLK